MRALERFLIAFAALAVCLRSFHVATAPVFIILGFAALALYYLVVFPFLYGGQEKSGTQTWIRIPVRILSCAALAYALLGIAAGLLNWIKPQDVFGNSCVVFGLLSAVHFIAYKKTGSSFSLNAAIRSGSFLLVAVAIATAVALF